MSTSQLQINPRLISALKDNEKSFDKDKPTTRIFPGRYASLVHASQERVPLKYHSNIHRLRCTHCGEKGEYDLGLVLVDPDKIKNHSASAQNMPDTFEIMDWIQPAGYFRCKHCNGAGGWSADSDFFAIEVMQGVLADESEGSTKFAIGQYGLVDGTIPHWASDAEEHWLDKLEQEESDKAFIWNRLGNVYESGGRPELAAAAFEQSLQVNETQIESHYSLANLLYDIDEWNKASAHYRKMCVYAQDYKKMKAIDLRDLLSHGLHRAMIMHVESEQQIPFIPDKEEIDEARQSKHAERNQKPLNLQLGDIEFHPDDHTSFYPLAEMLMGHLRTYIPKRKRALDRLKKERHAHLNYKKNKRKKHRKKKKQ